MIDDIVSKLLPYVKNIMWETKAHGNIPSIINRVEATASRFLLARARRRIVPCFHGHTNHFITLFMKHDGSHGTIYSTTHRYQYSSVLTNNYVYPERKSTRLNSS